MSSPCQMSSWRGSVNSGVDMAQARLPVEGVVPLTLPGCSRWGEFGSSTTSGHDIGPAGLDFLWVIPALELGLDFEPRSIEHLDYGRRFEKAKVKINALAPELFDVSDLITDVEGNEQAATSNQHTS